MRKQFMWLGRPGFYYEGPGNISIGDGSKGSVFFWYHTSLRQGNDQTLWEATFDDGNRLTLAVTGATQLSFLAYSGGHRYGVDWSGFERANFYRWIPVTCTWDFTLPGAGKLRLYLDGQEAPVQEDAAQAPLGEAMRLYLGPRPGTASGDLEGYIDNFTVWSGVMTLGQHTALRGPGTNWAERQNARRRRPRPGDCLGEMTLLATFDGKYDADVAGGSATAHWLVEQTDYNQFARIDDGARSRGERFRFLFGVPRHDNSEDDRVPLRAVLPVVQRFGADEFTTVEDRAGYSSLTVSELKALEGVGQGVLWLHEAIDNANIQWPSTVRMRVAIPDETNPVKTRICLGPVTYVNGGAHGNNFGTWGTGEAFTVVADSGNTARQFKTDLTPRTDGYWNDAELSVFTGGSGNSRLKVTDYEAATGVLTLAGALPAVPAAGDFGNVDFRGRLVPTCDPPNELQSLEAWLWEKYATDRPWTEIECCFGTYPGAGQVRYQRGRTTMMDMTTWRSFETGTNLMFGRNGSGELPESFACNVLIESLIIEGPGTYQVMRPEDTRVGRGLEGADSFMLRDLATGHSSRVWRWENCEWAVDRPTVNANAELASADLAAAGTWRDSALLQGAVKPSTGLEHVTGIVRGTDAGGAKQLGYVRGSWDESTQRVRWEDETPPAGAANPFLSMRGLTPWWTSDSDWGLSGLGGTQIMQTPDGKWSLLYSGTEDNPDHYFVRALHGAPDRWSFDPDKHWWPENPVVPGFGGVDKIGPEFAGINCFGNRDADWIVAYNPYARDAGRRFLAYGRLKTIMPQANRIGDNRRPAGGWTSPDLKSFFLLPHGNAISPLPIGEAYVPFAYAVSNDVTGMLAETMGGQTRLWASDDDRHFQEVCWDFLPDTVPVDAFRLDNRRVYFLNTGEGQNFATMGFNRDTRYELKAGQTNGMLETPVLVKPAGGWGNLTLNVDPAGGRVRVEVVDAGNEEALAGYGAEDCDTLDDGIATPVRWRTLELSEVTADAIRLRLRLSRPNAGVASPKVYAWQTGESPGVQRPAADALTVEGKANPAGVVDTTPTFGWSYSDARRKGQVAYHLIVASSERLLLANTGDVWDSGIVLSGASETEYGGAEFGDQTTYFWKVRVQNAEGVWSAEW